MIIRTLPNLTDSLGEGRGAFYMREKREEEHLFWPDIGDSQVF